MPEEAFEKFQEFAEETAKWHGVRLVKSGYQKVKVFLMFTAYAFPILEFFHTLEAELPGEATLLACHTNMEKELFLLLPRAVEFYAFLGRIYGKRKALQIRIADVHTIQTACGRQGEASALPL